MVVPLVLLFSIFISRGALEAHARLNNSTSIEARQIASYKQHLRRRAGFNRLRSSGSKASSVCLDSITVAHIGMDDLAVVADAVGLVATGMGPTAMAGLSVSMSLVGTGMAFAKAMSSQGDKLCQFTLEEAIDEAIEAAHEERDEEFAAALIEDYSWVVATIAELNPYSSGTTTDMLRECMVELRELIRSFDKYNRMYYGGVTVVNMAYELVFTSLALATKHAIEDQSVASFWRCDATLRRLTVDLRHIVDKVILATRDMIYEKYDDEDPSWDYESYASCPAPLRHYGRKLRIRFTNKGIIPNLQDTVSSSYCCKFNNQYSWRNQCLDDYAIRSTLVNNAEAKVAAAKTAAKANYWATYEPHYNKLIDFIESLQDNTVINSICASATMTEFPTTSINFTPNKLLIGTIDNPSNQFVLSFNLFSHSLPTDGKGAGIMAMSNTGAGNCGAWRNCVCWLKFQGQGIAPIGLPYDIIFGTGGKTVPGMRGFDPAQENEMMIVSHATGVSFYINGRLKKTTTRTLDERPLLSNYKVYLGTGQGAAVGGTADMTVTNMKYYEVHSDVFEASTATVVQFEVPSTVVNDIVSDGNEATTLMELMQNTYYTNLLVKIPTNDDIWLPHFSYVLPGAVIRFENHNTARVPNIKYTYYRGAGDGDYHEKSWPLKIGGYLTLKSFDYGWIRQSYGSF